MGRNDGLEQYRTKRDFRVTDEPGGKRRSGPSGGLGYAIQHHVASTEHYDLRLEHEGVLLSWAIAKGPSTDPRDKRLAIRTEDHPAEYLDFEGTIPEGEYGAGSVIVWDRGTWAPGGEGTPASVDEALEDGHLTLDIDGEKLHGGYVLQRFRGEDQWLLIKRRDGAADARRRPTSTRPESVSSGRTVHDLGAGRESMGPGR